MTSKAEAAMKIYRSYLGEEEGVGEGFVIDQGVEKPVWVAQSLIRYMYG